MLRAIRDLLTHARESFHTIRLECMAEYDAGLLERALGRCVPDMPRLLESGALARIQPPGSRGAAGGPNQRHRHDWRVWWRKPCCWRDDIVWENGAAVISTHCAGLSSSYVSFLRTLYTNRRPKLLLTRLKAALGAFSDYQLPTVDRQLELIPLLEPSFLASGWDLDVLGERVYAGRATLRVKATRRGAGPGPALWKCVDEYEILIDQERGVLLRYAGIVDDEEAGVLSVRSVAFDEPIPDEVFSYEPPHGTRMVWI